MSLSIPNAPNAGLFKNGYQNYDAEGTLWEPKTPCNPREIEAQSTLLRDRIQRHQNSSPTAILEIAKQLSKGATKIAHAATLQRDRAAALEAACEAATKRKARKRKRIQQEGVLTGEKGTKLAIQKVANTSKGSKRSRERSPATSNATQIRRCTRCRETGHNSRTYQNDIVDTT